jgi:hypothetical protein
MHTPNLKAFRRDLVEKWASDEEDRAGGEDALMLSLHLAANCMWDKTKAPCISLDPQGVMNLLSQYGISGTTTKEDQGEER